MNFQECDILKTLYEKPFVSQRLLAEEAGHSLGVVNRSVKSLICQGYLNDAMQPTLRAREEIERRSPRNAIILAAGFGMRMIPINQEYPKALLEVGGETLIERLIKQLHQAGVTEIYVVVGFMKECLEFLIDEYKVELIVNPQYAGKNNLHSLRLALPHLSNTYIVPCDIWCAQNPFRSHELYSWYMVSDMTDGESDVRVNRKMELVAGNGGNAMVGISYLTGEEAAAVRENVERLASDPRNDDQFWEAALYKNDRMIVRARVVPASAAVGINTYEQLRELDSNSNVLKSDAIETICRVFHVEPEEVVNIAVLKKGMTNRSFLFSVRGEKYIMRIPGEGTDQLIDRQNEAAVYQAISGLGLCDDPVYIDPENGYKITRFLEGVRSCGTDDEGDLTRAMGKLAAFHKMELKVGHTFDIFGQIDFYEALWGGQRSVYRDYGRTKENVFSLRPFIEKHRSKWCLTHIDAVPDNFLFYRAPAGEALQLTDWEYAGMQDPHVDIAMFIIYSMYGKRQADRLIDLYFQAAGEACDEATRGKIYAYIAACGLLWSNWCEFKSRLGVEFGEYSLRQYRFAKDYYQYAMEEIRKIDAEG